ncbi:sodium transport system permease protein [Luteibacter sp. UNCMF331Sha3.1]|uniref:ABC transporter permease n=1 Tax=Luteibacter sp. UNCMF331Sha3.1 TaxID=1502760 RepID=UPI0008C0CDFB|nr:ABC transporter permease [Luteibacter sp. UNCMF331Sha3.1]SEM44732.1 sodium transport system permease protein [Luteibacter sp. UNCMF331Sha3.1]
MNAFSAVYWKEVRENLRDRRTLINALITGPLLGPVMFITLMNVIVNRELAKTDQPLSVPVIGAALAPNLVAAMKSASIDAAPGIDDPEIAVREQRTDVVVRISPDYAKAWEKGQAVQVELIFDSSRRDAAAPVSRVRSLVEGYGRREGAMRLIARGLSPTTAWPVQVAYRDQATSQSRSALMFSFLPYFFVLTVFLGGMYLAIDLTAGERERQSLEPLFVNPVPRWQILAGKLGAICTFSLVSLLLSMAAFATAPWFIPTEKIGIALDLGWRFASQVVLLMLPLIVLLAALQSLVSAFAKSYREAQTYLSILMIVPVLPSALLSVVAIRAEPWMYAVPLLGQNLGIVQLLRGDGMAGWQIALCLGGGLVAAVLAVWGTALMYRSERLAISG